MATYGPALTAYAGRTLFVVVLCCCAVILAPIRAQAIEDPGAMAAQDAGIFTQLGAQVDLNRPFTDVNGVTKPLKDFALPGKPIVIAPVYYKCPRLCGLLLNGVYDLLNELPLKLSNDYSVLVVGFDPTETPADAKAVMDKFNARLEGNALKGSGAIHYVVGTPENVSALMNELGFKFVKDGVDFAHSAAVMILTSSGLISQYFTGIIFPSWDVRLSLVEASKGGIGTAIDHFLLYCFRFDAVKGRYTWAVIGLLRVGGALTLIGLGLVYYFFVRNRRGSAAS
jgi:protein SCO1/2